MQNVNMFNIGAVSRAPIARAFLLFTALCGAASCDSPVQPGDASVGSSSPFIVSNPVARLSSLSSAGVASLELVATSDESVVYVSLPPGAIPGGLEATIRNTRTGASIDAVMTDGGFDPLAVLATEQDSLSLVVRGAGEFGTQNFGFRVRKRVPPKIVRTDPPPQKRDVPLNYNLMIVFSEPMDPASLSTATVKLYSPGGLVAGQVAFSDSAHVKVIFTADAPLQPTTYYILEVTREVRDEEGDAPESRTLVPFTTVFVPVASVTVQQDTSALMVGMQRPMSATPRDAAGEALAGRTVTWSSSDQQVATVSPLGMVVAVTPGTATITATAEGVRGTAVVSVVAPVPIDFVPPSSTLSVGAVHSCALNEEGEAFCWGFNFWGQLGNGLMETSHVPVKVLGGLRFTMLAAGAGSTCGLTATGAAYCWGDNRFGQLGKTGPSGDVSFDSVTCPSQYTTACSLRPVEVAGGHSFVSIVSGHDHVCALTAESQAFCWGWGGNGELGAAVGPCRTGSTQGCSATPVLADGGRRFAAIAAGYEHTCGLRPTGAAFCWGHEHDGQLGVGAEPYWGGHEGRAVTGGLTFRSIATHWNSTCGVTLNGSAYCWGNNAEGQLGDGTVGTNRFQPVAVAGGKNFTSISVGGNHSCGIAPNGAVHCWGWNDDGALGDGGTVNSAVPVMVAGGLTFASISVGDWHSCAQTMAGTVYCWGWNAEGELGNGTSASSPIPVPIYTGSAAATAPGIRRYP